MIHDIIGLSIGILKGKVIFLINKGSFQTKKLLLVEGDLLIQIQMQRIHLVMFFVKLKMRRD